MKGTKYDQFGRDKKGNLERKDPWLPAYAALLKGTDKRKRRLGLWRGYVGAAA